MTTVKDAVAATANQYKAIEWVKCPICMDEWTKLEPMKFFIGSESGYQMRLVHACPVCCRSVETIPWLIENYGLMDIRFELQKLPAFRGLRDNKHFIAVLPTNIKIVPGSDRVDVYHSGDERKSFENIAQAYLSIVNAPHETEKSKEW